MIRISTKTRYALRALLEMACRNDRAIFSLGELARHQKISRQYLEIIFATLKKHGMVLSRAGKNGGFYLPSNLETISILRIAEALEGEIDIVNCLKSPKPCKRFTICAARMIWQELNTAIKTTLASKNLKDLSTQKEIQKTCDYLFTTTQKHRREKQ
jgi:Rrf2 family protein